MAKNDAYKLIIFDFDGTLADSGAWMIRALREMSERHRFVSPSDTQIEYLRGLSVCQVLKWMRVPVWRIPLIVRDLRKLAREATFDMFPRTEKVLFLLQDQGVELAILSSNSVENIQRVLGPLERYFAYIEGSSPIFGKGKRINKILRRFERSRNEVLLVGDEVRDIEAAMSQNVASAGVTWGYAKREALACSNPTHILEDIEDLIDLKPL
ncbi:MULTISPECIES: HAD family hydrolase [Rhizobium/Agrobacterium group]|uniref:Phosphatase n=3 Tax=Rhizobium/Agrobacterium group TaxID=227290 RepID=A0A2Z2PIP5_9HYPH|nr:MULTISPECIES: HAD family hydrolase [Rhizobium/Agrobacterium group]ARU12620.1 phosphoglycolate phosphatase VirP [Agrobacterium tumefaciens]ASK42021.1 phosphatase [Agrobacterium fabrum]MBB3947388.1 phosphoglycolate phosphatase [Rhizobium skierniewicense]NSL22001.1 HAD family hydrolase [Agrobacterium tumefaciens]NSY52311.1 HAD family hydrolase [Agrobacterium tumefaciens]